MTYKEAIDYIHSTPKFSRILGNDMLSRLLKKLDNPQNNLKFIHIAGTNGKGSVSVMLAEILKLSGYKTGLFISPFIERFNERISINGDNISDTDLADTVLKIKNVIEENDTPVSEFALDTAIAFDYFEKNKCDIVVLETGLGGRLDATNVIKDSVLSVITSVGMDHMQYLGDTIEKIAAEKCGIIRENGTVVCGVDVPENALSVVKRFCDEKNARLVRAKTPRILSGGDFEYNGLRYTLGMQGDFQKRNAATVISACEVLKDKGFKVSELNISQGLKNAFNPARFEKLKCGLYIDGAHNYQAIESLLKELADMNVPIFICLAMMQDKDIKSCVAKISEYGFDVTVTEIDTERCASAELLKDEFSKHGIVANVEKNPIKAAENVIEKAKNGGIAIAFGSLYFVGKLRSEM